MRADIRFNLVCSKCGSALEADNESSSMEYNSAQKATAKMAIKPCVNCYSKAAEPSKLLSRAIRMASEQ